MGTIIFSPNRNWMALSIKKCRSGSPNSAVEYGYSHGDVLGGSSHLRVSVSPSGVRVNYIRTALDRPAELAFSYSIP
jgi:hypothetical protein